MVRECGFLGAGVHRRVALRGGDGLGELAGLVVGVGGHHDGAARFWRVRVVAVEIFEAAGGLVEGAALQRGIGGSVHLVGRVGVQRLLRRRRRGAAGQEASDGHGERESRHSPCRATGRRSRSKRSFWMACASPQMLSERVRTANPGAGPDAGR